MADVSTNAMKMSLGQAGQRYLISFGEWEFEQGKKTLSLTIYCKRKRRCRDLRETQEDRTHFIIISVIMEIRLDFILKALNASKVFQWVDRPLMSCIFLLRATGDIISHLTKSQRKQELNSGPHKVIESHYCSSI